MISFILWYLAIGAIGWLAFPLGYRLLRFLPDRGATMMKPLGLLVAGFIFWSFASYRVIQNDAGGVIISLAAVAGLSWLAGRGRFGEMRAWISANRKVILIAEVLFLLAFAAWAVVRAAVPEASGTEKPMELAFINAILHSTFFPPHDPWLSGYAISYYYFGYVLVAMLAKLTGQLGSIAFNLGLASWFGLVATAAYGLLDNLLELRKMATPPRNGSSSHLPALLAPLFVLLLSNFGGSLEVMHAADFFWQPGTPAQATTTTFPPIPSCATRSGSQQVSAFWSWIDLQELNCPPTPPYKGIPQRSAGIWWWRSSRVLTDYDLNNAPREVIDEFPAFSYLLGDLHPHVLSMPFVLLAIALALNFYRKTLQRKDEVGWKDWVRLPEFWLAAVVLGGLSFLNTWDFPMYVALFAAAYAYARIQRDGWKWIRLGSFLIPAAELILAGVLLYLPFYTGFASQAGGLVPSLSFFTRGVQFWIMFGTLLVPIFLWLIAIRPQEERWLWARRGLGLAAGLVFGLWILSYLFGAVLLALPGKSDLLVNLQGGVDAMLILSASFARRLAFPGMWMSMLILLALIFIQVLWIGRKKTEMKVEQDIAILAETAPPLDESRGFVILMVLIGSGLVLFPEFFYLRDQFGWRMNTIFKFYFQAWMLWSVAAAYATVWLWQEQRDWMAWIIRPVSVGIVLMGLVYPAFLIPDRAQNFKPAVWSLDGSNYIQQYTPDEYKAILWLQGAPQGVVAEAVGGSYDAGFARIATHSGQPDVLGWPGHESQWRGGSGEIGSREADIQTLYVTNDWTQAKDILMRYQIQYVYVGPAEANKYHVNLTKFENRLTIAFQSGSVTIFEVPGILP